MSNEDRTHGSAETAKYPSCNELLQIYADCRNQKGLRSFFGACEKEYTDYDLCLFREYQVARADNRIKSELERAKRKQKLRQLEEQEKK
mmetsp:Transcript_27510/g.38798  ORF Transcript_27510/g.38798 Transcript_27510/m.38798 type:complete len:89 (+) Transcript_27510:53-319(+)